MPAAPGAQPLDSRPPTPDPFARLAWGGAAFCATAAVLLLAVTRDWTMALGVVGGGMLIGVSLLAIRSSVDTLIALMTRTGPAADASADTAAERRSGVRRRAVGALVRLVGRYALLALLAYVMIARLRLHPIGLLIGASSLVASAALEAVRVLTRTRTF